ncbi:MAG: enoyl-CoA hydratase-related protein, partial [Actinomycetota bacterium]
AIGVRRAREMSFTGNFMIAEEALQFGLVNHVVPHEKLIPFTRKLATDIAGNDQRGIGQLRKTYAEVNAQEAGWQIERAHAAGWRRPTAEGLEQRRIAIQERGRNQ